MRYYDLRVWRPVSQKSQNIANQRASAKDRRGDPLRNIPGKNNLRTIGAPNLLHLSSYLIHDQNNLEYKPGGSPQTGVFDPGALDIEFQMSMTKFSDPTAGGDGAYITIKGIDPTTIGQASKLSGALLQLNGGMGKGFPLANPKQAGVLLYGHIQAAYGNWEKDDLSLTLFVDSAIGLTPTLTDEETLSYEQSKSEQIYTFSCSRGASLKEAIIKAFNQNFPGTEVVFDTINAPITHGEIAGIYHSSKGFFVDLANAWENATDKQSRLSIYRSGDKWVCSEVNPHKTPIKIEMSDLIGQPTWAGPASITICCPLRGDLKINDVIILPDETEMMGEISPTEIYNFPNPKKRSSLFSGRFIVERVNHIGSFRSPNGEQWMTTIDCFPDVQNNQTSSATQSVDVGSFY